MQYFAEFCLDKRKKVMDKKTRAQLRRVFLCGMKEG